MLRRIITIDKELCNGCGLCVTACHEGAIGLEQGKAVLLRDDYCDGLGDCLPACPTGAISFEEREALPYDEAAVLANMAKNKAAAQHSAQQPAQHSGCPGARAHLLGAHASPAGKTPCSGSGLLPGNSSAGAAADGHAPFSASGPAPVSALRQWPVQLKLVPLEAPYLDGADLLLAADCAAYAYAAFHPEFMRGRITLIGCPKLDGVDYAEKLAAILAGNNIRSLTVARMSVPCCAGLAQAAERALRASGKQLPLRVFILQPDGTTPVEVTAEQTSPLLPLAG